MNQSQCFFVIVVFVLFAIGCKEGSTTPTTDSAPPSVLISAPADNSTVIDSAVIAVSATDNVGVERVEIYIDGTLVHTRSAAPWQYTWNVLGLMPNSTHTIVAKAFDSRNNVGTSKTITVTVVLADHAPPSVAISSPVNNATVSDSTIVFVAVTDNVGVAKVEFYVDGTLTESLYAPPWQYGWDVRNLTPGSTHTLLAKAQDSSGNTGTSSAVSVVVTLSAFTSGLVAYFPFNGDASDESGHGNDGITTNTALTPDRAGNPDKAYRFGGISDPSRIRIPNDSTLQFDNSFSISLWFRLDNIHGNYNGAGDTVSCLFAKDGDAYTFADIHYNGTRFLLASGVNAFSSPAVVVVDSLPGFQTGQWTHLAVVAAPNSLSLFVNGQLLQTQVGIVDMAGTNSRSLYLGAFSSFNYPLDGCLDDIRIYKRALSELEVSALSHEVAH